LGGSKSKGRGVEKRSSSLSVAGRLGWFKEGRGVEKRSSSLSVAGSLEWFKRGSRRVE